MTERFPELPEPWNNLAALEVADGRLDQAKAALDMAVRTDPGYAVAHENLGDLYMMLAARSYGARRASSLPETAGAATSAQRHRDPLHRRPPASTGAATHGTA